MNPVAYWIYGIRYKLGLLEKELTFAVNNSKSVEEQTKLTKVIRFLENTSDYLTEAYYAAK